jgi:hypothetical protein
LIIGVAAAHDFGIEAGVSPASGPAVFGKDRLVKSWKSPAFLFLALAGCGAEIPKPLHASEAAFLNTTADDRTQAEAHLRAAGIQGEIVGLISGEKEWVVDVAPKTVPGKRATPSPPKIYSVDRATGKAKRID